MCSFYDEHKIIIENPDNIAHIHVYSIHYVQSALFTTAVNVINIPHELGLDTLFSGSSKSLQRSSKSSSSIWSIIQLGLGIMLFILVTRRTQFDLYLLSFSSAGATFKSSTISSFRLWSKTGVLGSTSVYTDFLLVCVCVNE
jgi:hypothetical protein